MQKILVSSSEGSVDKKIIFLFAKENKITLPDSYINLISKYDYLYPKNNLFIFLNLNNQKEIRDIAFLGYKKDVPAYENIYTYSCVDDEYGYGNEVVAFGISANGDYICFDYRKNPSNPSIVLMYHDEFYEDELGNTKMITVPIASDFDSFIDKLYQDVDELV